MFTASRAVTLDACEGDRWVCQTGSSSGRTTALKIIQKTAYSRTVTWLVSEADSLTVARMCASQLRRADVATATPLRQFHHGALLAELDASFLPAKMSGPYTSILNGF